MLFRSRAYQYRVLFWGILGVLVLRAAMIAIGAAAVAAFSWIFYVFGAFLIFTGVKMLFVVDKPMDVANSRAMHFLRRHLRVTPDLHGSRFFVRLPAPGAGARKALYATPLFLALALIEFVDLVFAIDSVPAIFMITSDPFIVYTSNIFAILGLRALYFALGAIMDRFHYLKHALALVLIFIGDRKSTRLNSSH